MLLPEWSERRSPVIGMLHAMALPGAPTYGGDLARVRKALLADAEALVAGGVDGLMLENFGDSPFYPDRVPAMTVAALTALATEVRRCFPVPLGINVLRNDGRSALAVAVACGASFIRVNILCGARVAEFPTYTTAPSGSSVALASTAWLEPLAPSARAHLETVGLLFG